MTPMERTLERLKREGYLPWIVERRIPPPGQQNLLRVVEAARLVCYTPGASLQALKEALAETRPGTPAFGNTVDFYGIGDVHGIRVGTDEPHLIVQSTTAGAFTAHRRKIEQERLIKRMKFQGRWLQDPAAPTLAWVLREWLRRGRFELWGWGHRDNGRVSLRREEARAAAGGGIEWRDIGEDGRGGWV